MTRLGAIKRIQPRRDAGAGNQRRPVKHGETGTPRALLGGMQGPSGKHVVVRIVDGGQGRVVLRAEPAHMRSVLDTAVDGKADGAVEVVLQHLFAIGEPTAKKKKKDELDVEALLLSCSLTSERGRFLCVGWWYTSVN